MDTPTPTPTSDDNERLGPVGRARAGVAALRLLSVLEEQGRTATGDERAVLAKWPGWGPLSNALEENRTGTWQELGDELRELLTPTQLQQGLEACFNSFYTCPEVMQASWDVLTGLGFAGGNVLEPGCGSGRFIAATPEGVDASWLGVEADQVSAAIARHLHPHAMVLNKPMEEANLPDHSADAVIGNVPFGEVPVFDPAAPPEVTRTLHDYMIWSSVQALSPGGIAVLVTSCGTLDKVEGAARRALDADAALVGAIRLPNGTFDSQGTNTAADIIVLRRRTGEEPRCDFSAPPPKDEQVPDDELLATVARGTWTGTGEGMNAWFNQFPDMVLGTVDSKQYWTGVTVAPDEDTPWQEGLRAAVEQTVERARTAELTSQTMQGPVSLVEVLNQREDGLKEGRILTVEREVTTRGKTRTVPVIAQVVGGQIEEVRTEPKKDGEQGNLKPASEELFALIELRDAALELFDADADLENVSDAELATIRERTLGLYEAYTRAWGPIGRGTVSYRTTVEEDGTERVTETRRTVDLGGMRDDVDLATLLALENYAIGSNTATPADILHRRINAPSDANTYADSPHEAVAIALDASNRVDEAHIASLLGIPQDQVAATLTTAHAAFRDPDKPRGDLVPASTYLSGAIGHKLERAQAAAEDDASFEVNVQALVKARPEPLSPDKIEARLGATWIPPQVIEEFAREVLEIRCRVSTYRATGEWIMEVAEDAKNAKVAVANCEQWAFTPPPPAKGEPKLDFTGYAGAGPLRRGDELLLGALNNRSPAIRYYINPEKIVQHDKFSRDAAKIQERLQRAFATWVWQDPDRARQVADSFNRDFRSVVPAAHDGSRLTFPGMSGVIEPYQHQLDFVAMSLARPASAAIHDMGLGKTATMFMTAIKHVQLGLATNPIIVVPNGLLDDITREGKQLFPGARILMTTDRDMRNAAARKRFAYKCAANRWDAIVMTESVFSRIPVHPKTEAEFHDKYKADLAATFAEDAKAAKGAQAKKTAKKIKARAARAKALLSQKAADDTIYFEHLGSTMMLADEASDWMRNLGEFVKVEGIPMSSPQNAAQGFLKAMSLQMRGGKAVLFTGTPMVRTMLDLYSIALITNSEGLRARGIFTAEQFARTFIRFETILEPTADGQDVKLRRRVREPLNKDQLVAMFGESAHVVMGGLNLPELRQELHTVEGTPAQRDFAQDLAFRESQIKGWKREKGEDTYLSLVALGRAGALDPALARLPEDGPNKLDAMAVTIAESYHRSRDHRYESDPEGVQGCLQLAFVNQGVPHNGDPRTYGRLRDKLIAQGVPRDRIELVHDHDRADRRARLYEACRAGKVSVLIGSFSKMGYGVNVQDRLTDIHIADVGWNPADLRQGIKRGHRKGNLNDRVTVHYYPVKGTIDARFFALNEQRRLVEEAFFRTSGKMRAGEMGEIASSDLGSLSAIAADNPRLMDLEGLKRTLEDLEDEASMHESNLARSSANIVRREGQIEELREQALGLEKLVTKVYEAPDRAIRSAAPAGGSALEDKDVHERLNRLMRRVMSKQRDHGQSGTITYRGLSVGMSWCAPTRQASAYAELHHPDHPGIVHRVPLKEAWTRKGQTFRLTRAVTEAIDNLPDLLQDTYQQVTELGQSNERARQMLTEPFSRSEELESLRNEVAVLEEELAKESEDLAERAAGVEALALTEIAPVLSDVEGTDEVRVGYDHRGQMALHVDVDQTRLVRPPRGWREMASPGLTRTGRAAHGTHWGLTNDDAPFDSPLPYTAHITSTLDGLVRARVDVVLQNGPARGVHNTVLDEHHATYADALVAVRDCLAADLPELAGRGVSREMRRLLSQQVPGGATYLFAPVPPAERRWWDADIRRLSRTTPGTVLHTGLAEAGLEVPAHTHTHVDTPLKAFNGHYGLVRLTTGQIRAFDIVVDFAGQVRIDGDVRIEPERIAEAIDLSSSQRPGAVPRYLAPGQEPVLSASMVWAASTDPGDPLAEGSRSLRRNVNATSGLNALGKTVECTIDRRALGQDAADADRLIVVHGQLVEVDDSHLVLYLPLDAVGASIHDVDAPTHEGNAEAEQARWAQRWDSLPAHEDEPLADAPGPRVRSTKVPPYPLRVPMSAVAVLEAGGRTWKNESVQAARARVEQRRSRTTAEAAPQPQAEQPVAQMSSGELAERARAIQDELASREPGAEAALTEAADLLSSGDPAAASHGQNRLARGLIAAADADIDHVDLVGVVHQVADALADADEHALAVRLRDLYTPYVTDISTWKSQVVAHAHAWAAAQAVSDRPVPGSFLELLSTAPETWPRNDEGFDEATTALEGLLAGGHHAHAWRMREALRSAYLGRSDDWRMKNLLRRYDTVTVAAAHIAAADPAADGPGPVELPFPHGLGVLWGRDVVVLARDGEAYPFRVDVVSDMSALVSEDGRVQGVNDIHQVRTTDNRHVLLPHGDLEDLDEALARWGEHQHAERVEYVRPFHEALDPLVGTHVEILGSRSAIATGTLEAVTAAGVRLVDANGETTSVDFEAIGSVAGPDGARWWTDPAYDVIEQHLAAADRFLKADDHPTARRHLDRATVGLQSLGEVLPSVRSQWSQRHNQLAREAFNPGVDDRPLVQIERSGPKGRLARVYGIAERPEAVRSAIAALMGAQPELIWSPQERAYVGDPRWQPAMVEVRLEQLRQDLMAADLAHSTVTIDHPEPALPFHPTTAGHTAEPTKDRAPTSHEPAAAPRTRPAPEDVPASAPAPPTSAGANDGSTPAKAMNRTVPAPTAGEDDQRQQFDLPPKEPTRQEVEQALAAVEAIPNHIRNFNARQIQRFRRARAQFAEGDVAGAAASLTAPEMSQGRAGRAIAKATRGLPAAQHTSTAAGPDTTPEPSPTAPGQGEPSSSGTRTASDEAPALRPRDPAWTPDTPAPSPATNTLARPEAAVGLEEFNLVPGEMVAVRTRHDISGVKDPLRQLLIGTFEVIDGPLQRHSALTFSQGDRSFTTPLDNILEMVSTDGARHWRRDASRPSLIEDLLGLHALALDPAAPAQLPRTLIRLGRLPSEYPDLDSGTRSDAVSYSGAASYQTLFTEQLVDLVTDDTGAVPTAGDPPLADVDPLRRQIAVRIIDTANLSSPLGIGEREALRSRLVYTDSSTVPNTTVRFDSQAAAIRVSSATPEETAALDTLLRQRSIGFSQPAQDGTTTTWELRPSWSADTKAVRLRKALYVLHREGHAIIPEDLWHHLTASDKPLPANEDEAAPAPHEGTAEPLGPTTEPVQLSGRPELRTPEFHGANQAIMEALKRGDLATAQRIYEFRTDPREGALPNYVQQPGYELFAELGQAITDAQTVDSAVLGVMYQARDADLEHGDLAEALDLLALAEEISPENGQHTAELHRIRSALEAREVPGEEPIQELEALSSGATADRAQNRAQDEAAQPDSLERRLELAQASLGRGDYVTARGHLARADAALADVVAAGGPEAERWQRAHTEVLMRASSPRDAAGEPLLHIERTGPDGRRARVYGAGGGHEPVAAPIVHRILEASPRLIRDRDRNAYRTGPDWRDRTIQTRVDRLIQDLQDAGLSFAVVTLPHPEPDLPATPEAVRTPTVTENHIAPVPVPEWVAQEPEPGAASAPAGGELDGLFAVEPQTPTAEDVQLALDNVAAIPNPLGVFNGDQTWLAARARDAHADGDIAAATAYLTHQRMNEGRAASKLQTAVGHLVRFAPTAEEGHEASEPPTPALAAQEQTAAQEATRSVDHLFRAVIYRFDDTKIYVPADAPPQWREAIVRHGWRFDDDHAPWADSGASRGDRGRLREDLAKLTDPPAFIEAGGWTKRIREARGAEASDERLRQLRDVDQHRAHAKIAELIAAGDVRTAYAVMTEHTTALREAGLLPDVWVIDPDQGLADLYPVAQRASRDNAHEIRRQVRARDSWSAQEVADLAEQVHRQCPHLNAEQAAEILPEPSPTPKNPHVARAVEALAEMRQSSYPNGRRSVRRRLDAVVEEVKGRRVDRSTALELFAEYARIDPPAAAEAERGRARVALPTVDTPGFSDALVIREDFNHVVVHTPNDLDERVRQALTDHGFTAAEPGRFENRAHRPPPGDQLGRFLHTLNQLPDAPERMPATHHDRLMLGPAGARRVEHLPADPLPAEELHTAVVVSPDDHWILLPPGAPQAWHDILTGHGMDGGGFIVRRSEEAFAAEAEAITADLRAADPPARVMDLTDWQAHHRALVGDAAFEARHDALEVAQFQARDRLHDHLEEGDVLAAEAVALEHQTALWRAGLVHNPRQLDPERGLVDLSSEVWRRSLRNGEALLREIDQTQAWDEPSLTAMADRLRRESPLLSEALLDRLPSELREELATTEAPLGSQRDALAPGSSDQTPQQAPAPHDPATEEPAARLAAQTGARIVVFDEEQATLAVGTLEEVSAEGVRVREFLRSTLVPFEDIAGASTENGYWWADAQRDACQRAIMAADTAWDQRDFTAAVTHVEQATAYWETGPMPSPAQQNLLRFFFDQTRERLKIAQALQKQGLNWEYTTEPGYVSNPHLYVIGEGDQAQRLTPAEARALYLDGERDQTTAAKPAPQAPTPTPEPNTNTPGRGDPGAPMQQTEAPETPPEEERLGAARQALKSLSVQASPEHRDQLNTALQHLLDHDQHTDVARLARDADLVDPAGWWERADLLSTARFAHDPDSLATAVRIDYDGAKSTTVRITGDDSDRPVRELIKDKSGPYKARYDKSNRHWQINRKRKSMEDYRALLSDLLSDLDGLGRTWVTEKVHTELTERHRARAEAALAAGEAVAPVTADGHVGELADVLTYPALRVGAVIRQKDRHGEPRDAWIVVYDTGQGAELTEYTATEPTVRRGQVLTDVQVKIHDHAFSAQGEARTVIIRVPPRQARKFPLTPEQDQIRTAALEGKKFEVHAGAGTGKTATIGVVAESLAEQGRRGVYVVYGRANADEAAVKLAHVPIAANTIHAFARRAVGGPYSARINGDKTPNWQETARALGLQSIELPSGHPLDGGDLARLVDRAVQTFELSADLELSTAHIPRLPGLGDRDHGRVQNLLKPVLDRAWADMCDPAGTLFRYRHDTYVKIWQLTRGGPKMRIGGQGRPYLLVDEAQDMNPVAEAILQSQTHMQQGWVGDSSQAVHGWRGAEDALGRQNADVVLTLSQSFRFGEAVAAEANRWLDAIDARLRVKGTPTLNTVVHDHAVQAPDAVLARTNAGAFNAAMAQLQAGRRVAIVGGTDDLTKLVDAADKLKGGQRTTHPDLSHFRSWDAVVKAANDRPEDLGSLAPFVRLVDKLGTSAVRGVLAQMTDTDPEVEVCTAHKSKGLEWDRVQIADDFAPKEDQEWSFEEFRAEAQLAYVAVTRARKELGRGSLSYIDDYVGTASIQATAEDAVLGQEQAPAADEAVQDSAAGSGESEATMDADLHTSEEPEPAADDQDLEAEVENVAEARTAGSEPTQEATEARSEFAPVEDAQTSKATSDHEWVPDIPLLGTLEPSEAVERIRALTGSLQPKLVRAMSKSPGSSGTWNNGLNGQESTPRRHLLELEGLELIRRDGGQWYLTRLGEAVHNMLWRQQNGPDMDLPATARGTEAEPSAPHPTLFDAEPEPFQEAVSALSGAERVAAGDADPTSEAETVADPGEVTTPKPTPEEAREQDGLSAVEQQSRSPLVEPPVTGDSAPTEVDPKEAFDHGWVPRHIMTGELEHRPGVDRVRALAASLPPRLVRALDRWTGNGRPNRNSLDWASTPPKHMHELQELEIVFREGGDWWFTYLGEAVHDLLWRHKYGPEKDLPIIEGLTVEEPQPSLFDAAQEPSPAPQQPERTPPPPPDPVEQLQNSPALDPEAEADPESHGPTPSQGAEPEEEVSLWEQAPVEATMPTDAETVPLRVQRPTGWGGAVLDTTPATPEQQQRRQRYLEETVDGDQRHRLVQALSQDLTEHMAAGRWDTFTDLHRALESAATGKEHALWHAHGQAAQRALNNTGDIVAGTGVWSGRSARWEHYAQTLTQGGAAPPQDPVQARAGLRTLANAEYLQDLVAHTVTTPPWRSRHLGWSLLALVEHDHERAAAAASMAQASDLLGQEETETIHRAAAEARATAQHNTDPEPQHQTAEEQDRAVDDYEQIANDPALQPNPAPASQDPAAETPTEPGRTTWPPFQVRDPSAVPPREGLAVPGEWAMNAASQPRQDPPTRDQTARAPEEEALARAAHRVSDYVGGRTPPQDRDELVRALSQDLVDHMAAGRWDDFAFATSALIPAATETERPLWYAHLNSAQAALERTHGLITAGAEGDPTARVWAHYAQAATAIDTPVGARAQAEHGLRALVHNDYLATLPAYTAPGPEWMDRHLRASFEELALHHPHTAAARAASNPHGLWLPDQAEALANHLAAVPALQGADLGRAGERSSSTAQTPQAQQGTPAASPETEAEGPRAPQGDEAARMEANTGRGPNADPLEAGKLHMELADGEDPENQHQQAPGKLHVELADGEDHQAANSEGPEPAADDTNRVHEVPRLAGPYVENIDGRKLRASDRAWPGTLKQHGRTAAIERVDPRVHAKMLSQLSDAISAGKDVRLVMPSNDPARVKEIIDAAKARGYEVTVSARISPPLQRQAAMLSSLNHHFHEHTLNQAVTPTEHNTEQENLRKVLDQLYKHKAADRIELYPRTGDTPITSNHLVADHGPDGQLQGAVWAKNSHILDEVAKLENATLTPKEQGQIRQDMEQITEKLPAAEGLEGERLQARNYLEKEVDSVRRKMGLPPINRDQRARAYVDTPAHPEHEATQRHPQDQNGQKPGHDDWHLREPEDHHGAGERQPAMAGAPGEGAAFGRPQRPIPRTPPTTGPTGRPPGAGPRVGPHPHRQGYGPK